MNGHGIKSVLRGPYLAVRAAALWPLRILNPESELRVREVKKILVLRSDRLGDFVLSLPFLRALRAAFAGAEITLLARGFARELLSGEADCVELPGAPGLEARLKEARFDLAIDMHYDYELATAKLCRHSGARWRAGFDISGRGYLFNLRVPAVEKKHFVAETADILGRLGLESRLEDPHVELYPEDRAAANALAVAGGLGGKPLAVVHPGGFYPQQRWPQEKFAELLDLLHDWHGLAFALLGSAEEKPFLRELASRIKAPAMLAAGLNLRVAGALMSRSRVFIGNNSGPLHLACACGAATLSTMGPTDSVRWAPLGSRSVVVRRPRVEDIPVSEMAQAAERLLGE